MSSHEAEHQERIQAILARDRRYKPEAYVFTLEALEFTVEQRRKAGLSGHIAGKELLEGIREYALTRFGFLARAVFNDWGLRATSDFGEIVFNLIDVRALCKQDSDTKTDFEAVYDFAEAFEAQFIR